MWMIGAIISVRKSDRDEGYMRAVVITGTVGVGQNRESPERPSTAAGQPGPLIASTANSLTRLSLALLATPPQPPRLALHPQFPLLQLLLLPCSLPASVHYTRTLLPIKRANNSSSSCPVRLYRVVYSHSATIQYAANHPCHTIPRFGP